MADVPVPGAELTLDAGPSPVDPSPAFPAAVQDLLDALWSAGHAAYVVGGSLRDTLAGREPKDWDLATSALPEVTAGLFPGAVYENAFGTVAVRTADPAVGDVEITTFRSDHDYADFRRPHRVEFSDSIELDLARRDFTVNAIAWGAEPGATPRLVDPHGGRGDLAAADAPGGRRSRDAFRRGRAPDAPGGAALGDARLRDRSADLRGHPGAGGARPTSLRRADRCGDAALLTAERPSVGLRPLAETGLLAHIAPELASQRGVPQNKVPGEDLWDHTLRSVDGAVLEPPYIRLAALLHDLGKPSTMADGRFVGHEIVGADMARATARSAALADRGARPSRPAHPPPHVRLRADLVGHGHPTVHRQGGQDALDDLFLLREADNIGSGLPADAGGLAELRSRVAGQVASGAALDLRALAVDGTDLMTEFGWSPGPIVGATLQRLLDRVIGDPSLNTRERLLAVARSMAAIEPGS